MNHEDKMLVKNSPDTTPTTTVAPVQTAKQILTARIKARNDELSADVNTNVGLIIDAVHAAAHTTITGRIEVVVNNHEDILVDNNPVTLSWKPAYGNFPLACPSSVLLLLLDIFSQTLHEALTQEGFVIKESKTATAVYRLSIEDCELSDVKMLF